MKIQEAKELYQNTINDRETPDYLKIIDSIKRGILNKKDSIYVEDIPPHVITLLREDGYKVTFYSGFQREPDSFEIKGWV